MGGPGSGRWNRWDRAVTVDDCKSLDIRKLARRANQNLNVGWTFDGEISGTIDVKVSRECVELNYRHLCDGLWKLRQQHISLVYTPCHYGRSRPWFSCPGCILRCAKLYLGESGFFCRKCYRLRYRSQTSSKLDSLLQQRSDMEERMYGEDGWFKQGMHCKTKQRLMAKYKDIENRIVDEMGGFV